MGRTDPPPPAVLVDPACFLGLVNSAVEVYNRETTGLLVGTQRLRTLRGKRARVVALEAAYPLQTAARRVTWVEHGNRSAAHRARSAADSLGFRVVGEYHSHTNNEHGLSRDDLEYAREALRRMNGAAPPRWLELVLALRRKDYAAPRRPGCKGRDYVRKAGCTVVVAPRLGFDVTISGYWLRPNGRGLHCEEAEVRVPWDRLSGA